MELTFPPDKCSISAWTVVLAMPNHLIRRLLLQLTDWRGLADRIWLNRSTLSPAQFPVGDDWPDGNDQWLYRLLP